MTRGQMYDIAADLPRAEPGVAGREGIGDVGVSGSSLPAVRVELNPNSAYPNMALRSKTCVLPSPIPT